MKQMPLLEETAVAYDIRNAIFVLRISDLPVKPFRPLFQVLL